MNAILSRTQYSQRGMKKNNKKELVSKLSTVTSHEAVSYLLYHITSNHYSFGVGVLTYPAFSLRVQGGLLPSFYPNETKTTKLYIGLSGIGPTSINELKMDLNQCFHSHIPILQLSSLVGSSLAFCKHHTISSFSSNVAMV